MASLIEAVKRQALITFSSKLPSLSFEENFTKLKLLASKLTSADVKLDKSLLTSVETDSECKTTWNQDRLAPVTYIEIFENSDVTIGIFVLKSGARLPLHDHPLMYGVLKVIHGTVHILSYSPISRLMLGVDEHESGDEAEHGFSDELMKPCDIELTSKTLYRQISLLAVKEPEMLICEKDEASVLCPKQRNIHEIRSVGGPAAFLDILAPPYKTDIPGVGPRPCRYFKDVSLGEEAPVKKLVRIPSPADYWSDTAPYQGPSCMAE
ncbi:2-aminoethanethiol dioxygenase [Lycorma delicatula]|uniref:2-aminoethanethiol dioxygenase n=1 Tax=Lycorma delicatula TaxID=130591 RepID=UPI003F515574